MKFDLRSHAEIDKQLVHLKALQRLANCVYVQHKLKPGTYDREVLLAASILQFAPGATTFQWLNKHTLERILNAYVSEDSVLEAARALGLRVKDRRIQTSKAFLRALWAIENVGAKVEFPPAEQEKARTV